MRTDSVPYFQTVKVRVRNVKATRSSWGMSLPQSFADVPIIDSGVVTSAFLDASDGLVALFDLLGLGVFAFVQADLRQNIQGVRKRHTLFPSKSITLESMVQYESKEDGHQSTACLLRLLRGLSFTLVALQNSRNNPGEELTTSFKRAYGSTLSRHHGFAVRAVVTLAIKMCPRRHDFYARIAQGEPQDKLDAEMGQWLTGLESILDKMGIFFEHGGHGRI